MTRRLSLAVSLLLLGLLGNAEVGRSEMATKAPMYRWASGPHGLDLGIRVRPQSVAVGRAVDVEVRARNRSDKPLQVGPDVSLMIRVGDATSEDRSGPQSTTPIVVAAGQQIDLHAWRLGPEQLGSKPATARVWAVYRDPAGTELRTEEAKIEIVSGAAGAGGAGR